MESNCLLHNSGLFYCLHNVVSVLYTMKDNKRVLYAPDNIMHIFILDAKKHFIDYYKKFEKHPKLFWEDNICLASAFYDVINSDLKGVMVHGLLSSKEELFNEFFFSKEDLMIYADAINNVKYINECNKGLITSDLLASKIFNNYFYYFFDKDGFVAVDKEVSEEDDDTECFYILAFTTKQYMEKYITLNNLDIPKENFKISTLKDILNSGKNYGVFIDKSCCEPTAIAPYVFHDCFSEIAHCKSRQHIKDRVKHYSNLDEYYIVLDDLVNAINIHFPIVALPFSKNKISIMIYEKYEEALRFTRNNMLNRISDFHPIGKIKDMETLTKILNCCIRDGINEIRFDYGTKQYISASPEKVKEILVEDLSNTTKCTSKMKHCEKTNFFLLQETIDKFENLKLEEYNDELINANVDELIFLLNLLQNNEEFKKEKSYDKIYKLGKFCLYHKMSLKSFALIQQNKNKKTARLYFYDHNLDLFANSSVTQFSTYLLEKLSENHSSIEIFNIEHNSVKFEIEELLEIGKEYDKKYFNVDVMMFYLMFFKNISYNDAEKYLIKLCLDDKAFAEFTNWLLEPEQYFKELSEFTIF